MRDTACKLPENCRKPTPSQPRDGAFFMPKYPQEVGTMNRLIARLIDCGMSRELALSIYESFKRSGNLFEFERYVEGVEEECREPMEEV